MLQYLKLQILVIFLNAKVHALFQYAVKCLKMSQQSTLIAGALIQDTAEISAEALAKCTAEMNASLERML